MILVPATAGAPTVAGAVLADAASVWVGGRRLPNQPFFAGLSLAAWMLAPQPIFSRRPRPAEGCSEHASSTAPLTASLGFGLPAEYPWCRSGAVYPPIELLIPPQSTLTQA